MLPSASKGGPALRISHSCRSSRPCQGSTAAPRSLWTGQVYQVSPRFDLLERGRSNTPPPSSAPQLGQQCLRRDDPHSPVLSQREQVLAVPRDEGLDASRDCAVEDQAVVWIASPGLDRPAGHGRQEQLQATVDRLLEDPARRTSDDESRDQDLGWGSDGRAQRRSARRSSTRDSTSSGPNPAPRPVHARNAASWRSAAAAPGGARRRGPPAPGLAHCSARGRPSPRLGHRAARRREGGSYENLISARRCSGKAAAVPKPSHALLIGIGRRPKRSLRRRCRGRLAPQPKRDHDPR